MSDPGPEPPSGDASGVASRRHLGGGVIASTGSQLAILSLNAIASIAVARILGPSGSGAYALAATFIVVAMLVIGLGFRQGILYRVGSGRWRPSEAVRDLIVPVVVIGTIGAGISALALSLGADGPFRGIPSAAVPVVAASVPFCLAWQFSWSLALARERYESFAAIQTLPFVLTLVLVVVLALSAGTTGAVVALAAGMIGAGILGAVWSFRTTEPAPADRPPADSRRQRLLASFRFGLQGWGAEMMGFVNYRFDLFFLAAFVATAQVGIYSVAATVTAIGLILPGAVAITALPRAAALEGASARGELHSSHADISDARICRHTLMLLPASALVVAFLLAVGVPVLYGERFDGAVELGFILLPGILLLGMARVLNSIVMGRGHPRYVIYTIGLALPPTVAGYLVFIPDGGATAAALVSVGAYALTAALALFFFLRVTPIRARDAFVPRREDLRTYREVLVLSRDYIRSAAGLLRGRRDER